jgi:hypothetical protein
MFQAIMKLYEMQSVAAIPPVKGKYIYFGASVIYCDENNVCMVYYPDNGIYPSPNVKKDISTEVSSS